MQQLHVPLRPGARRALGASQSGTQKEQLMCLLGTAWGMEPQLPLEGEWWGLWGG